MLRRDWDAMFRELTASGTSPEVAQAIVDVQRDSSLRPDAIRLFWESNHENPAVIVAGVGYGYALLGVPDSAVAWFERAYEERSEALLTMIRSPVLNETREHPRMQEMLRRMGLQP
jgi:hypothetical protein